MILRLKDRVIPILVATHFRDRFLGFMGQKNISTGILFPQCSSIHTFFMKENIDVVGMNERREIIYLYRNLPKNQILRIPGNSKKISILELPKLSSKSLQLGNILFFEDEDVI